MNNLKQRAKNIKRIRKIRQRGVFMKLGAKIRAYLFTGILVTAPVGLTFYMVYNIVLWIDEMVGKLLPPEIKFGNFMPFTIPGLGLIVLIVGLTFVGMFAAGFMGRFFIRLGEWIVYKVPVISSIYSLLKQVFETFLSNKKNSFNKVVLIEYPRKGLWTLAFVSGEPTKEITKKTPEKMISIYVPTTPNPTSGFFIFIPKSEAIELKMTVEEALKYIISCGIATPRELTKKKK